MIIFGGGGGGILAAVDPRLRLMAVVALAVLLYAVPALPGPASAVVMAAVLAVVARVPLRLTLARLVALNGVLLALLLTVPLSVPGEPLVAWGGLAWSWQGLLRAMHITLQANAVMLTAFALLASLDPVRLGWGLAGLGVPRRLVELFFFVVRYIEVVHQEYHRLADAARLRRFSPRFDRHTLATYGQLVGQLMLRSMERAERILAAMRCRGFDGRFHLFSVPAPGRADWVFAVLWLLVLALVGWMGWRPAIP